MLRRGPPSGATHDRRRLGGRAYASRRLSRAPAARAGQREGGDPDAAGRRPGRPGRGAAGHARGPRPRAGSCGASSGSKRTGSSTSGPPASCLTSPRRWRRPSPTCARPALGRRRLGPRRSRRREGRSATGRPPRPTTSRVSTAPTAAKARVTRPARRSGALRGGGAGCARLPVARQGHRLRHLRPERGTAEADRRAARRRRRPAGAPPAGGGKTERRHAGRGSCGRPRGAALRRPRDAHRPRPDRRRLASPRGGDRRTAGAHCSGRRPARRPAKRTARRPASRLVHCPPRCSPRR